MVNYPPYVNGYGLLPNLFNAIKTANVPTKFNRDFVSTMLGLKSSSYNAMIPFMKNLGFLDQGNVPTQHYRDYRDESLGKKIMAQRVKEAYGELFTANEYAHRLTKEQVAAKLRTILGVGEDDKTVIVVAATFAELCTLGDFEGSEITKNENGETENLPDIIRSSPVSSKIGLNYTINLNLPATTDIEVFNAIFKSLKEHILNE
ncbi:DUF5343 domain-containing protein [Nitrosopumilus maritimus]|uniref:DUF5343 domain-containing protein n=1 Tax=Nitrosopumilus maritimus (strain SCM1) TaxID=436308 RepID=A9A381_NITMS|nr:DUF5343 domain-containing protein [Nitrosopumilus maritimus]ABX12510.1 conserved hypothetical protein [Nitrosopumilus maritimus SCM1]